MALNEGDVNAAKEHFAKVGMARYGWLPLDLQIAFHKGGVPPEQLRQLGSHFKAVKDARELADAFRQTRAKLSDPLEAFSHLLTVAAASAARNAPTSVVPKFDLADLFQLSSKRMYRSKEIHPLFTLLFVSGHIPSEHHTNRFALNPINAKWLRFRGYFEEVKHNGAALKPLVFCRKDYSKKDSEPIDLISILPIANKVEKLTPVARGSGLKGFHVVVHDPLYWQTARATARGLSRLTKLPVKVKWEQFEEARPYPSGKPKLKRR